MTNNVIWVIRLQINWPTKVRTLDKKYSISQFQRDIERF